MVFKAIKDLNVDEIQAGDTVKLKISSEQIVSKLLNRAYNINCKLICLNYGVFFFKEDISHKRDEIIEDIINNI